jgi:hypothetical protein
MLCPNTFQFDTQSVYQRTLFNHLKTERERERESKRIWGKARGALYLRGKKSILLEGTQAMPARPSDKDRMGVKTLLGWWVVEA